MYLYVQNVSVVLVLCCSHLCVSGTVIVLQSAHIQHEGSINFSELI